MPRDHSADPRPSLSVIIPMHNAAPTLERCLAAVFRSSVPPHQVIVVDDGSTDNAVALARAYPCQVICLGANLGAAAARNRGARRADADILFFLDSDIVMEPDTLSRLAATFAENPQLAALFGSYQKNTVPTNFVSIYKNYLHHHTHQIASPDAITFCGGYGAVRRTIFLELAGFDESQRALEDIEFGYRLYRRGYAIRLDRTLQFTHLKAYSLTSLVRSDVLNRAIPWTQLMLKQRIFRSDLNTRSNNVGSVIVAFLMLFLALLSFIVPIAIVALLVAALGLVLLNLPFLTFVRRERGLGFTFTTFGMLWLNYIYSGIGLLLGIAAYLLHHETKPNL